ncbi:MAG: hypothetical protein GY827_07990 [Cytophagales bacterium]|nr:hypothetical protein [Cytophagales bacterium]
MKKLITLLFISIGVYVYAEEHSIQLFLNNLEVQDGDSLWAKVYKLELKSNEGIKVKKFKLKYKNSKSVKIDTIVSGNTLILPNVKNITPSFANHKFKIKIIESVDANGDKLKLPDLKIAISFYRGVPKKKEVNAINTITPVQFLMNDSPNLVYKSENNILVLSFEKNVKHFEVFGMRGIRPFTKVLYNVNEAHLRKLEKKLKKGDYLLINNIKTKDDEKILGFIILIE